MTVRRLLQLGTATMAALGALLLRMGGNDMVLAYMATFAAVTSLVFTDWLEWFGLHRYIANTVALIAVSNAAVQFIAPSSDEQLLAIANLLIHLQIILLYQSKNQRVYWHLCVLSLLQVVVAAALNFEVEFGFLLVAYMFIGLATLTMLFLHQETLQYGVNDSSTLEFGNDSVWASPAELAEGDNQASVKPSSRSRGTHIDLVAMRGPNPGEQMINWQLAAHILRLGLTTLLVTIIVFFLTPRLGNSGRPTGHRDEEAVVGFDENKVELRRITTILDNPTLVMRVDFKSLSGGGSYPLRDEPYLRGAVLNRYVPRKGNWQAPPANLPPFAQWGDLPAPSRPPQGARQLVRQTVRMITSPKEGAALFTVQPPFRLASTPSEIERPADTGKLTFSPSADSAPRQPFYYSLGTTAFRNGWQRDVTPYALAPMTTPQRDDLQEELAICLEFERSDLPRLSELAQETIDESGVDLGDRSRVARVLEHHFRFARRYRYSTDLIPPFSDVDPVEYFVTETKAGHCEYFASALVLMLRSQGIPSRMVIGFRGGDLNQVGNYYQVRQRHAHAWVEAYLRPQDLTLHQLEEDEISDGGAWLRLDPTPVDQATPELMVGVTVFARIHLVRDYFQMLWDDYVLGLDPDRQREAIYQPLTTNIANSIWNMLFSLEWWDAFGKTLGQRLGLTSWEAFVERWFNWRAIPLLISFGLVGVAVYRALRRPVVWVGSSTAKHWTDWRMRTQRLKRWRVEFYQRLERALSAAGISRDASTTQREFARLAAAHLQTLPAGSTVADYPAQIAEAFYRVRFGGQSLSETEQHAMEEALRQLETGLRS